MGQLEKLIDRCIAGLIISAQPAAVRVSNIIELNLVKAL